MENKKDMIIGIDPGFTGAISFLRKQTLIVKDLPITYVSGKKQINALKLFNMVKVYKALVKVIVIEEIGPMPHDGRSSLFKFAYNAGIVRGALEVLNIPILMIPPTVWKPALGLSSDKRKSLALAKKTFTDYKSYFTRQRDDGRAEAALIAHFVSKNL